MSGEILVYDHWAEHADIHANPNSGNHPAPSLSVTLSLIKLSCGDQYQPKYIYIILQSAKGGVHENKVH